MFRPYKELRLYIYKDLTTQSINYTELAEYLQSTIPQCRTEAREEFLTYAQKRWGVKPNEIAVSLASARVVDIFSCEPVGEPLPGEVVFEERMITNPDRKVGGVLYEGYTVQRFYHSLIPPYEQRYGNLHTILTQRLLVTKELGDGRGHARTIILGVPVLISTSGLIEAPALSPDVYMRLQLFKSPAMQQLILEEEKQRRCDRVLTLEDKRLTEVVKGYVLMGVFYYLFGEQFCSNVKCRLYNAHTHEELIEAQIRSGSLCDIHQNLLNKLRE